MVRLERDFRALGFYVLSQGGGRASTGLKPHSNDHVPEAVWKKDSGQGYNSFSTDK